MKKALIRFEDIGPGGYYESPDNIIKLRAIAEYMRSEGVPFHVAMIPRFVNPGTGYDKSIADHGDAYVQSFHRMIEHLRKCGGSIGMHGYRHQYGNAVSADGFEFAYKECTTDCAPDDEPEAYLEREAFERSYASERMRDGFAAVKQSGLTVDWFETPHYTASDNQRWILESWVGMFFENDPHAADNNRISIRDVDTPLYRGVIYVPTPLYYVDGSKPDEEVGRITEAIKEFTEADVAAFFFHPFLEFPFLHIERANGTTRVVYEENTYLKRLIRGFKEQQFTFVPLLSLVQFVPSTRVTDFFQGNDFVFFTGDVNGDGRSELIVWQWSTGYWFTVSVHLDQFPSRQNGGLWPERVLSDWVKGDGWRPFVGDFNGDGKTDVAAWQAETGTWRFALSDGVLFHPAPQMAVQGWGVGEGWEPLIGDFNGDGRDEVAIWSKAAGTCYVLEGRTVRLWLTAGVHVQECAVRVGDFNGDGRDDLVLWYPSTGTWQVAESDGRQFHFVPGDPQKNGMWLTGWAVGTEWEPLVGDFDGDGKDDVLVVDAKRGDWQVAQNKGTHFVPLPGGLHPWAAGDHMQPLVGVFTDDGRASIMARHKWLRNGTVDFAVSVIGKVRGAGE
ncbi:MAG: DUF2334 domain-containing protein [Tumebacillaceae bacterium]